MPPKDNTRDIAMNAQSLADKALDRIDQHAKECVSFRIGLDKKMDGFSVIMDEMSDKLGILDDNNKRWTTIAMCGVIGFTALTKLPDLINWLKTMLGH